MTDLAHLRAAPFNLDDAALGWVSQTLAALTPAQKVGQLFVHSSMGKDPSELARLKALQPAGITRFYTPDLDHETAFVDALRADADIPLLISADLEGSRMSLPFGTEVPNPLALAAINDPKATAEISAIMASEARAMGINWSFTPVLDINAAFRSAIVATRGFGADPATIKTHALTQIRTFQAAGIAATVKHWPGEGHDDRDQHLVTTINPLSLAEWEASHGALYRAAIAEGVMSVMSAHIAFPAFVRSLDPDAGLEAFRPASASRVLTQTLLREHLGFNGLIVSDATPMAGFGAFGPRPQMLADCLNAGCDIILFSPDPETDHATVAAAIACGQIPQARVDQAIARTLALKAALGLHLGHRSASRKTLGSPAHRQTARKITARAPTLVKDTQGLLPLSPDKHRRLLIASSGIVSPIHGITEFALPEMLAAEGFEITHTTPEHSLTDFDAMLYLFGEETLLTRSRIFLDWARIAGNFHAAMQRPWHDLPTAMISFGYPYYLYDAPRVPTYINAFATMETMQQAVVDCLLGRAPWNLTSPHDPFCGLEDARY